MVANILALLFQFPSSLLPLWNVPFRGVGQKWPGSCGAIAAVLSRGSGADSSRVALWDLERGQRISEQLKVPGRRVLLVREDSDLLVLTWGFRREKAIERNLQMWRFRGRTAERLPGKRLTPIAGGQLDSGSWIATADNGAVQVYSVPQLKKFLRIEIDPHFQPEAVLLHRVDDKLWTCLADKRSTLQFGIVSEPLRTKKLNKDLVALEAGSAHGRLHLFVGGDEGIQVYTEGQTKATVLRGQRSWTESLTFVSYRGDYRLVSAHGGTLRFWDLRDLPDTVLAEEEVQATAIIPDPQRSDCLLLEAGREIRVQHGPTGATEELYRRPAPTYVECLAAARIGTQNLIARGFRGGIEVFDRDTGKTVRSYKSGSYDRTLAIGLTEENGSAMATALRFAKTIEIFDLSRPRSRVRTLDVPRQVVYGAAFTRLRDKWVLVAGGDGGWIQVLDAFSGKPLSGELDCVDFVDALSLTWWDDAPIALVAGSSQGLTKGTIAAWNLMTNEQIVEGIRWTGGSATAIVGAVFHGRPVIGLGTGEGLILWRADGTLLGEIRLDAVVIDLVLQKPNRIFAVTNKGLLGIEWLG